MAPYGVDQLLSGEGSDSFKAAVDRAIAIARQNGAMKVAQGVADAAARNAQLAPPSRLRGLPSPAEAAEEPEMSEDDKLQFLERLAARFMKKVAAERRARLNGEVVAADFCLRQITMLEVAFDLTAVRFGFDPGEVLRDLRRGGKGLLEIVSTPFADWLDTRRRMWWLQEGAPDRPPHPDPRFLRRHDAGLSGPLGAAGYSTYAGGSATGAVTTPARGYTQDEWAKMTNEEQRLARQQQYDEDATEQAGNATPTPSGKADPPCRKAMGRRTMRSTVEGLAMTDEPATPGPRTFTLNSREFYEAVTPPRDPWVWAGGLPSEPRFPRKPDELWVSADDEDAAHQAAAQWLSRNSPSPQEGEVRHHDDRRCTIGKKMRCD